MNIVHVVGARPNFMKVAPVFRALQQYSGVDQVIVHTGQHYDFNMSDVFFRELGLPDPHVNLKVGSSSHAQQTAEIMARFEPVVQEYAPRFVVVYGDVNSTAAAALVCSKLLVPVAHVEAGLRSFDRTMPEEINRLVTDQLSDLLFTHSPDADANLLREGVAREKIQLVGNVMIDTLVRMLPVAQRRLPDSLPDRYLLVTLHRPSNVDDLPWLVKMMDLLCELAAEIPVIFPVHPRTRQRLAGAAVLPRAEKALRLADPLPYLDFLALQTRATGVVTDSGGIQEETTFLGIPCITVRENTERPVTVTVGSNVLVGRDFHRLRAAAKDIIRGNWKAGQVPPLWDGHAGERVAAVLVEGTGVQSRVQRAP